MPPTDNITLERPSSDEESSHAPSDDEPTVLDGPGGPDAHGGHEGPDAATAPADAVAELVRPIAGVSIELYARIARSIELVGHDPELIEPMAAAYGVSQEAWLEAQLGWTERIAREPAILELYRIVAR